MRDRDSNETDQLNRAGAKPETPRLEEVISPLTTEDYGTLVKMDAVKQLVLSGEVAARSSVKVSTTTRYVIEIEVVKRHDQPLMFDVQSVGGEV
ncbi:MAG: hypothetical protein ACRCXB_23580 [Aeromonadaceae bacterium]